MDLLIVVWVLGGVSTFCLLPFLRFCLCCFLQNSSLLESLLPVVVLNFNTLLFCYYVF